MITQFIIVDSTNNQYPIETYLPFDGYHNESKMYRVTIGCVKITADSLEKLLFFVKNFSNSLELKVEHNISSYYIKDKKLSDNNNNLFCKELMSNEILEVVVKIMESGFSDLQKVIRIKQFMENSINLETALYNIKCFT